MLRPAPRRIADAHGVRQDGAFEGSLEVVDWAEVRAGEALGPVASALARAKRLLQHKRWWYAAVSTPEVLVSTAIVHLGYVVNAFVFAADLPGRRLLFQRSFLGLPGLSATIAPRPGAGASASFRARGAHIGLARGGVSGAPCTLRVRVAGLSLDAALEVTGTRPLSWIGPIRGGEGGLANCTQKIAGAPVSGRLVVHGRDVPLDGALGGLDFTDGLLARETAWRWAFAQGAATSGEIIGLNLVEGFNEPGATPETALGEDAVWIGGRPCPLGPARFDHDRDDPHRPWRVTTACGAAELRFTPGGRHAETHDLGLARSRFLQVAGTWDGRITLDGVERNLVRVPGVAEDQAVRW
jgi:hypothetical protein